LALLKQEETLLLCHCERSLRSAAISSVARGDRHAEKASARDDMIFCFLVAKGEAISGKLQLPEQCLLLEQPAVA